MAKGFTGVELKDILTIAIKKLFQSGLRPMVVINDQGLSKLGKALKITIENPVFEVEGNKLVYMFDSPHLLKSARNNLIKYSYEVDGYFSSFGHVRSVFDFFSTMAYTGVVKLTPAHIDPTIWEKMRVRLATQVMSNSVACALELLLKFGNLPPEAEGTAKIVSLFDRLFDTLNASLYNHPNKYKNVYTGTEEQKQFLNDTFEFLSRIKLIDKSNPDITSTCSLFIIEKIDELNFKSKKVRTLKLIEKYKKDFAHYKNVVTGSEEYYKFINEVEQLILEIRVLKNNKSKTDLTSKVNIFHGSSSMHNKFIFLFKCSKPRFIETTLFEDIEQFLKSLQIYQQDQDVTSKVKFLTGFQTTIKATMILFDFLKEFDHDYIATRRLNQDSLENFFGSVRRQSGNCTNPTCRQFGCVYNQLSVLKIMDHCDTFNCEDDGDGLLLADECGGETECKEEEDREDQEEDLSQYFEDNDDFGVKP